MLNILKGQEYKIVQKYLRLCTFCGFYVHKIHKMCTISNIFGQSYIPDPLVYSTYSTIVVLAPLTQCSITCWTLNHEITWNILSTQKFYATKTHDVFVFLKAVLKTITESHHLVKDDNDTWYFFEKIKYQLVNCLVRRSSSSTVEKLIRNKGGQFSWVTFWFS